MRPKHALSILNPNQRTLSSSFYTPPPNLTTILQIDVSIDNLTSSIDHDPRSRPFDSDNSGLSTPRLKASAPRRSFPVRPDLKFRVVVPGLKLFRSRNEQVFVVTFRQLHPPDQVLQLLQISKQLPDLHMRLATFRSQFVNAGFGPKWQLLGTLRVARCLVLLEKSRPN